MTVLALAPALKGAAALLAALAAAAVLLAPGAGRRTGAMVAAVVLSVVALATVAGDQLADQVSGRLPLAAAGAVVALAALAAAGWAFRRWPGAFLVLAVAALPFRIPFTVGGESASLLLPLYAVVAGGLVARLLDRGRTLPDAAVEHDRRVVWTLRLLALSVALYAAQSLYSSDVEPAVKDVCFFYVPFAVLLRLLVDRPWNRELVLAAMRVTVGLALLFAVVAIFQWFTRTSLLANEKVLFANELKPYFRVSSLFFDPNIYGRYLALAMLLVTAALLWTRRRATQWLCGGTLLVLWAGLVPSLSESSFAALTLGLAVLAALRWRTGPVVAASAVAVLAGVAIVILAPSAVGVERGINQVTSGRADLLEGGLRMARDRPVLGFGSGSFAERFRAREGLLSPRSPAESHTIPVTVAAEQGIVGLLVYAGLLWATLSLVLRDVRRRAARAAVGAAFAAVVLHTLVYAAFLEDPLTWALLAAAIALRRAGVTAEPVEPLALPSRRRPGVAA